jgi:hypothetical protein
MSAPRSPVIHDGQDDAMPCQCPACRSPFITNNRMIRNPRHDEAASIEAPSRNHMREARAC